MKVIKKKYNAFCHVQNNIVFHMKGKLIKTTSVLWRMSFRRYRYVAAPLIHANVP